MPSDVSVDADSVSSDSSEHLQTPTEWTDLDLSSLHRCSMRDLRIITRVLRCEVPERALNKDLGTAISNKLSDMQWQRLEDARLSKLSKRSEHSQVWSIRVVVDGDDLLSGIEVNSVKDRVGDIKKRCLFGIPAAKQSLYH